MAKARDYAGEYAKRIARGEAKGISRAESRGHKSSAVENLQRQVNTWIKKSAGNQPLADYRAKMKAAQKTLVAKEGAIKGNAKLVELLKNRAQTVADVNKAVAGGSSYFQAGTDTGARQQYEDRDEDLPPELFWYNGD